MRAHRDAGLLSLSISPASAGQTDNYGYIEDSVADALLFRFRPILKLHPSETSYPARIDWYLPQTALYLDFNGGQYCVLDKITNPADVIRSYSTANYTFHTREKRRFFLKHLNTESIRYGEGPNKLAQVPYYCTCNATEDGDICLTCVRRAVLISTDRLRPNPNPNPNPPSAATSSSTRTTAPAWRTRSCRLRSARSPARTRATGSMSRSACRPTDRTSAPCTCLGALVASCVFLQAHSDAYRTTTHVSPHHTTHAHARTAHAQRTHAHTHTHPLDTRHTDISLPSHCCGGQVVPGGVP